MRLFAIILTSLLVAGAIIWAVFLASDRYSDWKAEKNAIVADINRHTDAATQLSSDLRDSHDIADLEFGLELLGKHTSEYRRLMHELIRALDDKPFFPLTRNEAKMRDTAYRLLHESDQQQKRAENERSAVAAAQIPLPTPTPLPDFVILNTPIAVTVKYGTATLPRGSRHKLISATKNSATILYGDEPVEVPLSATDLKP